MRKYQGILFAALFCFAMLLLLAAPGTGSGGETIRLLSDGGGWDAAYL